MVIITAPAWSCFPSQFIPGRGKSTGRQMPVILSPKEYSVSENHSLNSSCLPSPPVCGEQAIDLGGREGVTVIVGVCQPKDITTVPYSAMVKSL